MTIGRRTNRKTTCAGTRRRRLGLCALVLATATLTSAVATSPAQAIGKRLDRDGAGQAIASACAAGLQRVQNLNAVYDDLSDASPASRWRSFLSEYARVYAKNQTAFSQIQPLPGADGNLAKKIAGLLGDEVKALKPAQVLLRKGRVSDALASLETSSTRLNTQEVAIQDELAAFGYQRCELLSGYESSEPGPTTARKPSFDPSYFPAVAGLQYRPLAALEADSLDAIVKQFSSVYSRVEGREVADEQGTAVGLVVVFELKPGFEDPASQEKLLKAAGVLLKGSAPESIGGFTTVTGGFSIFDKVAALRSNLFVELTMAASPNRTRVIDFAKSFLA